MAFGFAYGEAFGPTGSVPTLWLAPLDHADDPAGRGRRRRVPRCLAVVLRPRHGQPLARGRRRPGAGRALRHCRQRAVPGAGAGWHSAGTAHLVALSVAGGVLAGSPGSPSASSACSSEAGGARPGCRAGRRRAVRRRRAARHEYGVVRPPGRVRPDPRRPRRVVWTATVALWHHGRRHVGRSPPWCSWSATSLASRSRRSSPAFRRCGSSTTSCSRGSSPPRAVRFRPWHVPTRSPKEEPCSPG